MLRVYHFVGKGAYIHCFDCGCNIEITEEEAEKDWESFVCPKCGANKEEYKN